MSNKRIALVFSAVNMRRYTAGLKPFVSSNIDYWHIDIYRPLPEIFSQLKDWAPDGIITEELPGITSALISLNKPTIITPSLLTGQKHHGVNVDDFEIGQVVGAGNFSKVYKAFNKKSEQWVVLKVLRKESVAAMKHVDHIINERNVLKHLTTI